MPKGKGRGRSRSRSMQSKHVSGSTRSSSAHMAMDTVQSIARPVGGVTHRPRHPKASLAKKVWLLENSVAPQSTKYIKVNGAFANISQAPVFTLLNPLSRGTSVQTRQDDDVMLTSGYIRFVVANATNVCLGFRSILIFDKEPNKSALTATIMFDTATPALDTLYNFNNYDWMKRFVILFDKTYNPSCAPAQSEGTTDRGSLFFDEIKWKKDLLSDYSGGNAGTIADINTGSLWLVTYGYYAAADFASQSSFQCVTYFKDN